MFLVLRFSNSYVISWVIYFSFIVFLILRHYVWFTLSFLVPINGVGQDMTVYLFYLSTSHQDDLYYFHKMFLNLLMAGECSWCNC